MTNVEKNAIRVLGVIIAHGKHGDGLIWAVSMIAEFISMDQMDVAAGIRWLRNRKYIFVHNAEYGVTNEGKDWYRLIRKTSKDVHGSLHKFKQEVLTGARERIGRGGKPVLVQTKMKSAALPKKLMREDSRTDYEPEMMTTEEIVKGISDMTGMQVRDVTKFWQDGRIKLCKGYNCDEHIGVFDKNGKYLRNLCRVGYPDQFK